MRIAVLWPRPRRPRIEAAARDPAAHPDASDGLLFLEQEGFSVSVEDPNGVLLNPLARSHEVFCGMDPVRAWRVARRRPPYDAIVSIGASSAWFTQRFAARRRPRIPVIMIDPAMGPWKLRRRVQDLIIPRVARVVVFGRVQLDELREAYGDQARGVFLHHRADVRFFDPDAPASKAPDGRYLLAIGDDVSRDFATLVRASAPGAPLGRELAAKDLRCVIHTRRDLGALPPRVIQSSGRLSHVELRGLYRHAAAVVLPLFDVRHAGGINSLVEAMAMARPIVISRSRGILDYVTDGETALTVAPGDPGALAAAVARILEDSALGARLGAAARAFVESTCASPLYARKIAAVVREVIAE
jgi:glycosyltransferase involved in cell wall biosynthesis